MKPILLTALFCAAANVHATDFLFKTVSTDELFLQDVSQAIANTPEGAKCLKANNCFKIEAEYLQSNNPAIDAVINNIVNGYVFWEIPEKEDLNIIPSKADFVQRVLEQIKDEAEKTERDSDQTKFTVSIINRGNYKDLQLIEVRSWYYFAGYAHGWGDIYERVFTPDGKLVDLYDITIDKKALDKLAKQALQQWYHEKHDRDMDDKYFYLETNNFTFTPAGIKIVYLTNTITSYREGTPEITIPYRALKGVIADKYLPQ